jgi:hypothetical protein
MRKVAEMAGVLGRYEMVQPDAANADGRLKPGALRAYAMHIFRPSGDDFRPCVIGLSIEIEREKGSLRIVQAAGIKALQEFSKAHEASTRALAARKIAEAHSPQFLDYILSLPNGYDGFTDEDGPRCWVGEHLLEDDAADLKSEIVKALTKAIMHPDSFRRAVIFERNMHDLVEADARLLEMFAAITRDPLDEHGIDRDELARAAAQAAHDEHSKKTQLFRADFGRYLEELAEGKASPAP